MTEYPLRDALREVMNDRGHGPADVARVTESRLTEETVRSVWNGWVKKPHGPTCDALDEYVGGEENVGASWRISRGQQPWGYSRPAVRRMVAALERWPPEVAEHLAKAFERMRPGANRLS